MRKRVTKYELLIPKNKEYSEYDNKPKTIITEEYMTIKRDNTVHKTHSIKITTKAYVKMFGELMEISLEEAHKIESSVTVIYK